MYNNDSDKKSLNENIFYNKFNEKYVSLSQFLSSRFSDYKNKRKLKEDEWLRNSAQYNGVYESEVLSRILPGLSSIFDNVTRVKVQQFTSSAIDLVLPEGDKNFVLFPTPNKNLPKKTKDEILERLKAQLLKSNAENGTSLELLKEDIDQVEKEVADIKARRMEETILDQLIDSNYIKIMTDCVESSAILGSAYVRGPYNKSFETYDYVQNEYDIWDTVEKTVQRPYIDFISAWDVFPDLDAKDKNNMDGCFFYHTLTKQELLKLTDRKDFFAENIEEFVKCNMDGNFEYEPYERSLKSTGNESASITKVNKFRAVEYWGSVSGSKLKEIFPDKDLKYYKDYDVCVWMLNNIIIKCVMNPYKKGRPYHIFNFKESDSQVIGTGIPSLIEEKQMALNSITRAIHDSVSKLVNPPSEVNDDLLAPGQSINRVKPGDVYHRIGLGPEANMPLIKQITMDSHLTELLALARKYRDDIDDLTNINPILQGDLTGQASSGRTASGINSLMGGANLPMREFARKFDFLTTSIVSMMIEWNIKYNENQDIKGDFQVYARASTALIEKQRKANSLNNYVLTIQPEERERLDWRKFTRERLFANNLDPDTITLSDKEYESKKQEAQNAQAQQQELMKQAQALIDAETQSKTTLNNAKAEATTADIQVKNDKNEIDRLKTFSGMENNMTKNEISDNKLKMDAMTMEQNFSRDTLSSIADAVSGTNPRLK